MQGLKMVRPCIAQSENTKYELRFRLYPPLLALELFLISW